MYKCKYKIHNCVYIYIYNYMLLFDSKIVCKSLYPFCLIYIYIYQNLLSRLNYVQGKGYYP